MLILVFFTITNKNTATYGLGATPFLRLRTLMSQEWEIKLSTQLQHIDIVNFNLLKRSFQWLERIDSNDLVAVARTLEQPFQFAISPLPFFENETRHVSKKGPRGSFFPATLKRNFSQENCRAFSTRSSSIPLSFSSLFSSRVFSWLVFLLFSLRASGFSFN